MLPPAAFDRSMIAAHLRRRPPDFEDFVVRLALEDLADRLLAIKRPFRKALIMAPDATPLPQQGQSADGPFAYERASTISGPQLLDAEALHLPSPPYDLVVSILDLQVVNDVPGFLARIRAHLAPDGHFVAAFLGGNSLTELRQAFLAADAAASGGAFARVAPFVPLADCGGLLQRAGFALPVIDLESHIVRYDTPLDLMRELKALGASNPLADRPASIVTPRLLAAAAEAYAALASDPDGRVRATLELLWMSGWAPHESQQQPLRPGSAKVSLAAALGKPPAT